MHMIKQGGWIVEFYSLDCGVRAALSKRRDEQNRTEQMQIDMRMRNEDSLSAICYRIAIDIRRVSQVVVCIKVMIDTHYTARLSKG